MVRIGVPANFLLILISVIALFVDVLPNTREQIKLTTEAQSPYSAPETSNRDLMSGGLATGSVTPQPYNMYGQKSSTLVVVNKSPGGSASRMNSFRNSGRGFVRLDDAPSQRKARDDTDTAQRGAGNRGSSGVFGTMINQAIMKSPGKLTSSVTELKATPPAKQSIFNWSRTPTKTPVRTLGISRPIMIDEDPTDRQFVRVPTIDLVTAQQNDTLRRQMYIDKQSPLAYNPVGQQAMSSVREESARAYGKTRAGTTVSPGGHSILVPRVRPVELSQPDVKSSSTTSATLSPGRQEVRRRSPRGMSGFDFDLNEGPSAVTAPERKEQIGLPANPRSRKMSSSVPPISDVPKPSPTPVVMLMNDIIYDNPLIVENIMREAEDASRSGERPKTAGSPSTTITLSEYPEVSVMHRPRPLRRDFETDRAIFPAEPYSRHKRSRSTGSLLTSHNYTSGRTIETQVSIPSLSIPKTAAELKKILPNNSQNISFDEKVQLLFPAPPSSSSASTLRRRSSVPSIPRIPSLFAIDEMAQPSPLMARNSRASRRTTIASLAHLSIVADVTLMVPTDNMTHQRKTSLQKVADQDINYVDSRFMEKWEEKIPVANAVLTTSGSVRVATSSDRSSIDAISSDDISFDWESIHSSVPEINLAKARQNARSTYIKGNGNGKGNTQVEEFSISPTQVHGDQNDTIPVILDDGTGMYDSYVTSARNSRKLSGKATSLAIPVFHHRVGQTKPPTFSARRSQVRVRKMPPPPPLMLYNISKATNIVIQAIEPSPISSPEMIIAEINAQLDRMEEDSNRSSVVSSQATGDAQMRIQDRMQLLENLEREMQDIERLQTELARNSISTTTSSAATSPHPPPKVNLMSQMISNQKSNRYPQNSTQIEKSRGGVTSMDTLQSSENASSESSDTSRVSLWQQRLAEAQLAYSENLASTSRNSLNFLPMPNMQLASPTPPESVKSEADTQASPEVEVTSQVVVSAKETNPAMLWKPLPASPDGAQGRLWSLPYEQRDVPASPEPPAKDIRPAQRVISEPMQISTSDLWSKSDNSSDINTKTGLWKSQSSRSDSTTTPQRPRLSVKPTRKSRPLTLLPDIGMSQITTFVHIINNRIVESPIPLPHKRETLGLYQFPWGEVSDQAVYQPTYLTTSLSSTGINTRLDARSSQLASDEYSSSFFDDYEDDESGDEEANFESSDDEFDDSTLFEIADLLRSNDVPSRQSLFSPVAIVSDYVDEMEYASGSDRGDPNSLPSMPALKLPIQPLELSAQSPVKQQLGYLESAFSNPYDEVLEDASIDSESDYGSSLEEDDSEDITFIMADHGSPFTTSPPNSTGVATLEQLPALYYQKSHNSIGKTAYDNPQSTPTATVNLLWAPMEATTILENNHKGLFTPPANIPTTKPAMALTSETADILRKPRTQTSALLPKLLSKNLWTKSQTVAIEHDWISESSIRAVSPSAYSPSPLSAITTTTTELGDDIFDTVSIRTASTKASTIWDTVTSSTPIWWQSRGDSLYLQRTPSSASVEAKKPASGTPSLLAALADREAELNSKIPKLRRQKSMEKCTKLKDQKDHSWKTTLPEVPENTSLAEHGDEAVISPTKRAMRSVITKDAWIADLNSKATIIGPAFTRKVKPVVTETEWIDALNDAIAAGQLSKPTNTVVSKDVWVAGLESAISNVTLGHTVRISDLWTPASVGKVTESQSLLWSFSTRKVNHDVVVTIAMCLEPPVSTRRAYDDKLQILESSSLWVSKPSSAVSINWLSYQQPALSCSKTWSGRRTSPAQLTNLTPSLWSTANRKCPQASPKNLFEQIVSSPIRHSFKLADDANKLKVQSNTLFTTKSAINTDINWLQRSSASATRAVTSRKRSLTWNVPDSGPVILSESRLWEPRPHIATVSGGQQSMEVMDEQWFRRGRSSSVEATDDTIAKASGSLWAAKRISRIPLERNWLHNNAWWVR